MTTATATTASATASACDHRLTELPLSLAYPPCACDEDLAFLGEGLREVAEFHREMCGVLAALLAVADASDLPASLRPVVQRARALAARTRAARERDACGLAPRAPVSSTRVADEVADEVADRGEPAR